MSLNLLIIISNRINPPKKKDTMKNFDLEAKQNIAAKRIAAEYAAANILAELRKDAKYFSKESEKLTVALEIAKKASKGQDTGALKTVLQKLNLDLDIRAKELGYESNDLSPKYSCISCNDSGYINGQECTCLKQEKYRLLKLDGNVSLTDISRFDEVSLSSIPSENLKSLSNAYSLLEKFIGVFPEANKSHVITILGSVGCGKTYAASVVANAIMLKGFTSLLIPSYKLADLFSQYHYAFELDKPQIFSTIYDVDLLIIDDLGTEEISGDFVPSYLYQLLCNRADKFTIFTTNHKMDTIQEKYGKRVYSRIADKTRAKVIELNGIDLRL